ncbi:equilibrative nucleobase transporter 1-like [Mytilus trossulus]|uniref:equilibrative nucleobase transporter 1-like n=1 Tax=Mytilus trossulus TaxID=6551 RepID=UPI003004877E
MAELKVEDDDTKNGNSFEAIDTLVHECLHQKLTEGVEVARTPRGIKLDSCKRARDRANRKQLQGRTIRIEMNCTKRHVTFIWALLECLLFTGLIFGWPWFLSTLRRNKYFLDLCNVTLPDDDVHKFHDGEGENALLKPGGIPDFDGQNAKPRKCRRRTTTVATTEFPGSYYDSMFNYTYFCDEQEEKLELIHAVVFLVRNALVFPVGIFLDMYGTTRTRLLTILIFIVGTLMMTFSNASFPWLIVPAFSMFSIAGCIIMLTNLQTSNLFGDRRYTVMSSLIGGYQASAIVFLCIKSMNDIQTSFMFMTMGVVPILVSTIAFLPKTKVPWPLPADYGDGRSVAGGSSTRHRQSASEDGRKCCLNLITFKSSALSSLFIWSTIWYGIYTLRAFTYDSNLRLMLISYGTPRDEVYKYSELFAAVQTISLPAGPLIGLLVDWKRSNSFAGNPLILQMKNVQFITFVTFGIALVNNILTTIPSIQLQVAGFILQAIERVAVMTSICAFLTHLHFPAEHFGKLIGLHFLSSSILCLLRFPFQSFINTSLKGDPFYINLLLLVLLILSCGHPFLIWYHCRIGLINNSSLSNSSNGREQLVITIEDENDNNHRSMIRS